MTKLKKYLQLRVMSFLKGNHIIEGSKFEFNSISGKGSFIDAYGILDIKSFNDDFNLNAFDNF